VRRRGRQEATPFLVEILALLLPSPVGQQLRENAQKHRRSLAHELEANLILFNEHIPTEKIAELAAASQRHPDQMLVRLVLLGLRVYVMRNRTSERKLLGLENH
jgi:hypothetical protein